MWPDIEGILYPFAMKALAWGWSIEVKDHDLKTLKSAFKTQDLELVVTKTF